MDRQGSSSVELPADDFARLAADVPTSAFGELLQYLRHNKKWWLTPIFILLLLIGALVIFGSSAAAPFIYTLF